jgi:biotin transport system substrate-specific component
MALTESTTLGGIPIEVGARDGKTRTLVWALAFVLAMVISAYVIVPVPFSPVPITLQVLVVLLAGTLMGPWVGAAAMAAYLAIGISGAPVFAGAGAGFAWLAGPTGGYLLAFPLAAAATGALSAGRDAGPIRVGAAMILGVAIIYLGGISQLAILTGQGLPEVFAVGVIPFVIGDLLKIGIGCALVAGIRSREVS